MCVSVCVFVSMCVMFIRGVRLCIFCVCICGFCAYDCVVVFVLCVCLCVCVCFIGVYLYMCFVSICLCEFCLYVICIFVFVWGLDSLTIRFLHYTRTQVCLYCLSRK